MKIVLLGDSSVGKSALVMRYISNQIPANAKATVGVAFFKKSIVDPDTKQEYTTQIWDTAGQEKFQSVTTHHYRNADGALLVFDITSEASFQGLDRWLTELYENTDPSTVVMLVGTKVDLNQQRQVSEERARAWARKNSLLYSETSSLWDSHTAGRGAVSGAEGVFLKLVQAIANQQQDMGHNPLRIDVSAFGLGGGHKGLKLGGNGDFQKGGCDC
jgi:small GTP-binding protein